MTVDIVRDCGAVANAGNFQTAAIQRAFDLCRDGGGTVVIPRGKFRVASLRMYSNTTLHLTDGAILEGSDVCDDYEIYPVPEGVEMRSDMEMITQYYGHPWDAYRRAIISAYGEKNIAITGEGGNSTIDGVHCYDPNGEEGYRGPHAIYITNCEHVRLENYTVRNAGNFMHQLDNCRNTVMQNVVCLAGSDGIHLHCCDATRIEDCTFITGDDCIAGINVTNLLVRHCTMNTSCDIFRIGGCHIHVEDCHMYGPGYYPHRMTVVKGKNNELPREEGRHNLICLVDYFASTNYPYTPSDIHFKNCVIENAENILYYHADCGPLQSGTHFGEFTLENVRFTDLKKSSKPTADADEPLTIRMKNVTVQFHENSKASEPFTIDENAHINLIVE